MYEQITSGLLGDVQEIVRLVNDRFNNEINKVFGRAFQDQAAGISDDMIIKNWNK
jgi:hypothetical protein